MAIKVGAKVAIKEDAFQAAYVVIGRAKNPVMVKGWNGQPTIYYTASGVTSYRNEWHVQNLQDGSLGTYHINELEEWD